jgi:hypothetical protein
MNKIDIQRSNAEAQVVYLDADFRVTRPGAFVLCATTGRMIAIENLRYWSVERQEPYVDADAALKGATLADSRP